MSTITKIRSRYRLSVLVKNHHQRNDEAIARIHRTSLDKDFVNSGHGDHGSYTYRRIIHSLYNH